MFASVRRSNVQPRQIPARWDPHNDADARCSDEQRIGSLGN
jgi:hypothetical protein